MNRKIIGTIGLLMIIVLTLSGCADLKDKFVRKSKEEAGIKQYYAVRPYDVHPSLELYTKRYVYWKSWHRELLSVLSDDNHKKKVVAIEQEVGNLMDMQRMLVDEKAEPLQKIIDQMSKIETQIKKERVTQGNEVRIRKKLESLGRQVKKDYSYNKIRDYIGSDFRKK
ncbi:MAG: hypothetical protein U9R44_05055 [Candidatus Omnitrophota bacterium]|nr:hypothetical protein [Candidatus Omnitrophota bacterium]